MSFVEITKEAFSYFLLVLHIVSIGLHCLGIYLLLNLKHEKSNQPIILMNLSTAEIFMSAFDLVYNVMLKQKIGGNISEYFYIIQCTCFVIPSFLILTFLALDRFFEVYLNLKYPIYFSRKTVLRWLLACWMLGLIQGVIMVTLQVVCDIGALRYIFVILFPFFEFIFFTVAVTAYSYLYIKYRKMQRKVPSLQHTSMVFRRRKMFVPTLILFTFFLFAIIPDQLHLFMFYVYRRGSDLMMSIILTLYVTGFICDACIYIFLQKGVRILLMKKLCIRRSNCNLCWPRSKTDLRNGCTEYLGTQLSN